ncbi:hypothetical protein [Bradyrhizobium sp.]
MVQIHRDSRKAWDDLCKRGGLELNGRDEGLDEQLKNRLKPSARSLDEALRTASTDELVSAFFAVMEPYVLMFRAILDFFEKAGATEGREQWNITVDDVDVRLEHFRRFLKKWNSIPCEIEVPAVDRRGAWAMLDATRDMPEMDNVYHGVGRDKPYWSGIKDVDDWLRAYRTREGRYEELPPSLAPSRLGAGYADVAAVAMAALHTILKGFQSRQELIAERGRLGFAMDEGDGLSIGTIGQNETDLWLGTLIARLARALALPDAPKRELGKRLQDLFARYPRRKFGARLSLADLQSYLSLPVWQKRNELYAVWIATEIVNALPDHICKIHNEEGKIVFAFHETVVATVESAWPPVRLISERRIPLKAPVGDGRTGGVQPDYGLWRNEAGGDTCGVVIEVKHYKKSAPSRFGDVLTDYSRALPHAEVYLVNHGPIGNVTADLPRELWSRCHTVANLTVPHLEARDDLRKAVRKYVGEPVVRPLKKRASGPADTVLAIDVSASMSVGLAGDDFREIVREIVDGRCGMAALVDVRVRTVMPLGELPASITAEGSGTSLQEPVLELLRTFKRVLVITDDDGLNSLSAMPNRTVVARRPELIAVEVLAG